MNRSTDELPTQEEGAIPAILLVLVVLAAVVALFLLLKFNLFNGGTSNNVRTTLPVALPFPVRV